MAASMEALGMFFARHCSTTLASWALSAGSGPPSVVKGGTVGIMGGGGAGETLPKSQRIWGGWWCRWDGEILGEPGGSVGWKDFWDPGEPPREPRGMTGGGGVGEILGEIWGG